MKEEEERLLSPQKYSDEEEGGFRKTISFARLGMLNAFGFAYGMVGWTLLLIVLPSESKRLFPQQPGFMSAVLIAFISITMSVAPAAGYLSDRSGMEMGKRRFYLILGCVITLLGLTLMHIARITIWGSLYLLGYLPFMFGLNAMFCIYNALLADVVPTFQLGQASGFTGSIGKLGSVAGFIVLGWLVSARWAYVMYGITIFVCTCLTLAAEQEVPIDRDKRRDISCAELLDSYVVTRSTHEDFFWVFLMRLFYFMATSVQSYLFAYLNDVIQTNDADTDLVWIAMLSHSGAALMSYAVGSASNRVGRKVFMGLGSLILALCYAFFLIFPTMRAALAIAFFWGIGNGMFIGADFGMAVRTIPNPSDYGRDLGLWCLSGVLGFLIGGAFNGLLVSSVSGSINNGLDGLFSSQTFPFHSYIAVITNGELCLLLCVIFLSFIKQS